MFVPVALPSIFRNIFILANTIDYKTPKTTNNVDKFCFEKMVSRMVLRTKTKVLYIFCYQTPF